MLAYVRGVQRHEIREGLDCVKHQEMAGSNIGDDHKNYFYGDAALLAGGKDNTMNQCDDVSTIKKAKINGINGVNGHSLIHYLMITSSKTYLNFNTGTKYYNNIRN